MYLTLERAARAIVHRGIDFFLSSLLSVWVTKTAIQQPHFWGFFCDLQAVIAAGHQEIR